MLIGNAQEMLAIIIIITMTSITTSRNHPPWARCSDRKKERKIKHQEDKTLCILGCTFPRLVYDWRLPKNQRQSLWLRIYRFWLSNPKGLIWPL